MRSKFSINILRNNKFLCQYTSYWSREIIKGKKIAPLEILLQNLYIIRKLMKFPHISNDYFSEIYRK